MHCPPTPAERMPMPRPASTGPPCSGCAKWHCSLLSSFGWALSCTAESAEPATEQSKKRHARFNHKLASKSRQGRTELRSPEAVRSA